MRAVAAIVDGPITRDIESSVLAGAAYVEAGAAGASLRFEGIVRREEDGRELVAIEYQTYDPMVQRELESLARSVGERHGLISLTVLHSRGRVPVGEVSFSLTVTAPHRAGAIAAVAEFIDRLKRDVPIWKIHVWK